MEVWGLWGFIDSSSEATGAKSATGSNSVQIIVPSERCEIELNLSGFKVQCCLRFFVWMGGFFLFFFLLIPHSSAQICGPESECEEFYPVLDILVVLAPLSPRREPQD